MCGEPGFTWTGPRKWANPKRPETLCIRCLDPAARARRRVNAEDRRLEAELARERTRAELRELRAKAAPQAGPEATTAHGGNSRLVTVAQAADRLGVSKETIRRMVKRGTLAAVKLGAALRIQADSVEKVAQGR